jgi:hypothetical protein
MSAIDFIGYQKRMSGRSRRCDHERQVLPYKVVKRTGAVLLLFTAYSLLHATERPKFRFFVA